VFKTICGVQINFTTNRDKPNLTNSDKQHQIPIKNAQVFLISNSFYGLAVNSVKTGSIALQKQFFFLFAQFNFSG